METQNTNGEPKPERDIDHEIRMSTDPAYAAMWQEIAESIREYREPKPRQVKHVTGEMREAVEIACTLLYTLPKYRTQAESLKRLLRILNFKDGWLVFHRSAIREFTMGEPVMMQFTGEYAAEIEDMYFGRDYVAEKRKAMRARKAKRDASEGAA